MSVRQALDLVATVAIIGASALVGWSVLRPSARPGRPEMPVPPDPISIPSSAFSAGSTTAPIALVLFSDFQCPFCAKAAKETLPDIIKNEVTSGKVRLVFWHLPIEGLHASAVEAAVAATCASVQGAFWPMHDGLFARFRDLDGFVIREVAASIAGVNMPAFESCLSDPSRADAVRAEAAAAKTLRVNSTPTFFLGTVASDGRVKVASRFTGAVSPANIRERIDGLPSKGQ